MTSTRTVKEIRCPNGGATPLRAIGALSFLALSALLLLAACGGGGEEATPAAQQTRTPAATPSAQQTQAPAETPKPSAGAIDPCALVTKADAEAILGRSLGEPERGTIGPFETCNYGEGTFSDNVQVQVSSELYTLSGFDDGMKAAAELVDAEAKPVSGLGDKAYSIGEVLYVQKGDVTLNFLVATPKLTELTRQGDTEAAEQQRLALATDLAAKALGRLH